MSGGRRQVTVAFKKNAIEYAEAHSNLAARRENLEYPKRAFSTGGGRSCYNLQQPEENIIPWADRSVSRIGRKGCAACKIAACDCRMHPRECARDRTCL
ncbi:hypothetical protein V5799_012714 [Amblyomma americanum]|uniref:Uncharacterized protein n=1 Tax=Amblyomma americanum TaxID=6943 RepID=A0AAQ4E7W4_AMBAM